MGWCGVEGVVWVEADLNKLLRVEAVLNKLISNHCQGSRVEGAPWRFTEDTILERCFPEKCVISRLRYFCGQFCSYYSP